MASRDRLTDRRNFLKAAGGAAAAATLAGCIGGNTGDDDSSTSDGNGGGDNTDNGNGGDKSGTLTYTRGSGSGSLDFQNTTSGEAAKVTNQIYDTLIAFKPGKTSLTEGLATNWKVDGKTVTLDLRKNVKFHNGETFTADDFVASYRRFVDTDYKYYPGKKYASSYGPYTLGVIEDVKAKSDNELEITLEKKYAPILPNLAMFVSAVHSKKAIKEKGKDLKSKPVGTGPFKFKNWDTNNNRIRLEKNDDYWGDGPYVDEVVFTVVGSNTSRAQTLDTGNADIIDGLGAQSSKQVKQSGNAELVSAAGINVGYMAFNMAKVKPFRKKKVRQAISYAINTKAIVNTIFDGIAKEANQPIPESVMGYNDSISPYEHNPEKAKKLLKEAGYGDGFSFELATFKNPRTYNPSPIQAAQTVKSNLHQVGIEVTIHQQAFDPFLDYTSSGKHDACFLGWMTDNADPDNFYYALLHPGVSIDKVPKGQDWVSFDAENFNTLNVAGWANTDFMKLVEDAQVTYDNATRKKKYKKAGKLAHDEAPWVFMDHAKDLRGVHNRVSGFELAPISGPFLRLVKLN
ncbi:MULTISPECIES: ABC transporter substrate-binding protein [unclassified Haladaptatus]|uniref:ABC transporter substrate-binding protein n=1 Tax=unclassified Haladaptatus TaxID=2622732 RepID=UPI00209C1DB5|nr:MULTISPECIES: ABC transporter substrate-binding protein [unclassified Haladaptatus]MCO8246878.1 ABC transporter substrate-binding protein [Haladaptatus sp. AB643]MCO8253596.1 ABC transporter substrate-binding protein [Haladaptatus sp. AB618]